MSAIDRGAALAALFRQAFLPVALAAMTQIAATLRQVGFVRSTLAWRGTLVRGDTRVRKEQRDRVQAGADGKHRRDVDSKTEYMAR